MYKKSMAVLPDEHSVPSLNMWRRLCNDTLRSCIFTFSTCHHCCCCSCCFCWQRSVMTSNF